MNSYYFVLFITALILGVSTAFTLFHGWYAITRASTNPHRSLVISCCSALPAWFIISLALLFVFPAWQGLAIRWFGANGWIFSGFMASIASLTQYTLLVNFTRK